MSFMFQARMFARIAANGDVLFNRGLATSANVRTGAGNYVLTCLEAFDANQNAPFYSIDNAAFGDRTILGNITADGQITIVTKLAGADADSGFYVWVADVPGLNA